MLISDFIPRLLVDAPECPDETARQAIVASAMELCKDAFVWNAIGDPIPLIDGIADYDIESPDDGRPVGVMQAWLPSRRLTPKTLADLGSSMADWTSAQSSEPVYFNNVAGNAVVRVFPTPMNANRVPLTLRVAFAPTRDATTLDDDLVDEWDEAILQGARARLFRQPRKPWTDLLQSKVESDLFDAAKADARIQVIHDGTPGTISVQPREFGF